MEGGNGNVFLSHGLHLLNSSFYVHFREGKTNAHMKGDYQRIGDVMLRNMRTLKVAKDLNNGISALLIHFCPVVKDDTSRFRI